MDQGTIKQTVKDTVDVVEFISQYTSLVPSGRKMKGLSPFTNEKTPSFFVDPEAGFYYCFSSQAGGDIFSFVQSVEGVDFKEALKIVAEYAGVDMSASGSTSPKNDININLYHILECAQSVYKKHITLEVREEMLSRGITDRSIEEWGIGYAPDSWNTLCNKQMANLKEYDVSGLCIQKEKSVYDRFRDRVMFPFYDTKNRIIGFSGRARKDTDSAKYINSPESPLFNKSAFLYGLNRARSVIRKSNVAMLVEGPIDAIMAHQAGYKFAVATSGTAVTKEHLLQLQRLSNRLIIAFDGDAAGERAVSRILSMGLSISMDTKVVVLSDGTDPADIIAKDPKEFKEAVRHALPSLEYLFSRITKMYGEKNEDVIRGVREEIIPVIINIQDPLMRESAIRDTAQFCSLRDSAIRESIENFTQKKEFQTNSTMETGDNVFVRLRSVTHKGDREKDKGEEKMARMLNGVGMGIAYLKKESVSLSDEEKGILQEVSISRNIPDIDYRIADIHYEEEFPDEKLRNDQVRAETFDLMRRLRAEILKKNERDKGGSALT